MATAESQRPTQTRFDRDSALTVAATATLLAVPALVIGGQPDSVRAGAILALLIVGATAAFGRAAYHGTLPRPFNGSGVLILMVLYAALTTLSVGWSLLPAESYLDAVRLIAYTAVVATAALAAQLARSRSREVVAGIAVAATILVVYALFSRVFPGWYPASDSFARLRMPFEYWNAVGSIAMFGLVATLWMGTQRSAPSWMQTASYPAGGLSFVALLMSQSRGALFSACCVVALWLLLVDRRLRSVAWLFVVGGTGSVLVAWAYSQTALTLDYVLLPERESTGRMFGVGLLLMTGVLTAAGFWIERRRATTALAPERRTAIGKVLLVMLAISPIVMLGGVALKADNGLGAISDRASALFESDIKVAPPNSPDRLTQTNSLRARYWSDSYKIWEQHRWLGTGADTYSVSRLPYRTDTLQVAHAHGFVAQVLSDLGLIGLTIVIALAIAWLIAALRMFGAAKTAPVRWLADASDGRLAGVSLALIALGFGIHSALDWTWFIPGVALFGLVAAGWTAGSNVAETTTETATIDEGKPFRIARTIAISIVGLAVAFAVYQPVRAQMKINDGLDQVASQPAVSLKLGQDAHGIDPTSDEAFFLMSAAQINLDRPKAADATLMQVATEQPGNPETWLRLAEFRLNILKDPAGAIGALIPLLYQSPNNQRGNTLLTAAKEARIKELIAERAEIERRKLERELKQLQRELASQGLAD